MFPRTDRLPSAHSPRVGYPGLCESLLARRLVHASGSFPLAACRFPPRSVHLNQTLSGPIRSDSWIDLGGYAKQISAAMNGVVYAIGVDNAVYEYNDGGGWDDLGGYAKHIGAGVTSALGSPVVYAISLNGPVPFGNNIVGRAATRRGEGY